MAVSAMQGAVQEHQEQFGVQYLAQGHFNMQTREMNQQLSNNKTLALPLSHSHPSRCFCIVCQMAAG